MSRPDPTKHPNRGEVRADEVRVLDIVSFPEGTFPYAAVVTSVELVGDDVILRGYRIGERGEMNVTTSQGNGVTVVGRAT